MLRIEYWEYSQAFHFFLKLKIWFKLDFPVLFFKSFIYQKLHLNINYHCFCILFKQIAFAIVYLQNLFKHSHSGTKDHFNLKLPN